MKNILDPLPAGGRISTLSTLLLAMAVAPHFTHINFSVMLSFFALVVLKLLAIWKWPFLGSRWIVILAAIVCFANSAWHYGIPIGRDPGVSFLVVLLGLKILESRSRRDAKIVLILGYFVVITHFLYFANFTTVIFLFTVVFAITWLLIQVDQVSPARFHAEGLKLTMRMAIQAIPFALILFFLFPRFAGQFWLFQSPSASSITGMSEEMSMGSMSNLVESGEIAFTATFDNNRIPAIQNRYWRAGIFWLTDGKAWSRGRRFPDTPRIFLPAGEAFEYEIVPGNARDKWLYSLDMPAEAPDFTRMESEGYLSRPKSGEQLSRYQLASYVNYIDRTISNAQRTLGTMIPRKSITPRMRQFVAEMVQKSSQGGRLEATDLANRIMTYFNQNEFIYTLQPPLLTSNTPVDEFLFETRQGFCEHYAATFTTLMRMADVPARVVVGYLGGELNPRADQISVSQADAHAWSEFWSDSHGWIRADPTAAIAPERIRNSINFNQSLEQNGQISFLSPELNILDRFLREARWYSALAKIQWNRWFVGYDYRRQQTLLRSLGIQGVDIVRLSGAAFIIATAILIIVSLFQFRYEIGRKDRVISLYNQYCRKLTRIGIEKKSSEGASDYFDRCASEIRNRNLPLSGEAVESIVARLRYVTDLYNEIRYGSDSDIKNIDRFKKAVKQLNINSIRAKKLPASSQ